MKHPATERIVTEHQEQLCALQDRAKRKAYSICHRVDDHEESPNHFDIRCWACASAYCALMEFISEEQR